MPESASQLAANAARSPSSTIKVLLTPFSEEERKNKASITRLARSEQIPARCVKALPENKERSLLQHPFFYVCSLKQLSFIFLEKQQVMTWRTKIDLVVYGPRGRRPKGTGGGRVPEMSFLPQNIPVMGTSRARGCQASAEVLVSPSHYLEKAKSFPRAENSLWFLTSQARGLTRALIGTGDGPWQRKKPGSNRVRRNNLKNKIPSTYISMNPY